MKRIGKIVAAIVMAAAAMMILPAATLAATPSPSPSPTINTVGDVIVTEPPLPPAVAPPELPHIPYDYTVKGYKCGRNPDTHVEIVCPYDITYAESSLGLTLDQIKFSNPDKDLSKLNVGDTLTVSPVPGVVYKVKTGDTLNWIAYSFQVNTDDVAKYNNMSTPDWISPDQALVIPEAKLPQKERPVYTPVYSSSVAPVVYRGGTAPGNHFTFGYCTWYVANQRPIPWFGNANEWWANARAYGFSEGHIPQVGAVLVENFLSAAGHVAYVTGFTGTTVTIAEMNYTAWDYVDARTLSLSDPMITGYIY